MSHASNIAFKTFFVQTLPQVFKQNIPNFFNRTVKNWGDQKVVPFFSQDIPNFFKGIGNLARENPGKFSAIVILTTVATAGIAGIVFAIITHCKNKNTGAALELQLKQLQELIEGLKSAQAPFRRPFDNCY